MPKIILFFVTLCLHLHAANFQFEAGAFQPLYLGEIENPATISKFRSDLNYDKSLASYFAFEAKFDTPYIPNFRLSHFYITDTQNADFNSSKTFVAKDYNGSATSTLDYRVINATFYKSFHQPFVVGFRGTYRNLGDFYFDAGINIKNVDFRFDIHSNTAPETEDEPAYISFNSTVVMPHVGLRYAYSRVQLFANGSALAIGEIKSNGFRAGFEVLLFKNVSFSGGYMYEDFEAVEYDDKITFVAAGTYASFILNF